jgi:uncharacterized protein with ATP-grasp and redox domains
MTSELGSFARATIVERKPEIIRRVIADNAYPPGIVTALEAFRDEIAHGIIRPLIEDAPDVASWNTHQAQYADKTWLEVPWYFAETYFYRRLLEATHYFQPGLWRGHDPFARQKRAQEAAAVAQLATMWAAIEQLPPEERFVLLLHSALWGNRADLSNFTVKESAHRGLEAHTERANLLIDDTESVLAFFTQRMERIITDKESVPSAKSVETVAFINDNVGADSLFDLALADFLLTQGWVQNVVFYLKNQPFFVSDAMPEDIRLVIRQLQNAQEPTVAALGNRLHQALLTTPYSLLPPLSLITDPFWTSCLSFWELPPVLCKDLTRADLIILKGDVNYRRLLDDRHWPHTTPIERADAAFPRPYLILRTLKGEIAVSLEPGQVEALSVDEPDWLINGKRGIIQLVRTPQMDEVTFITTIDCQFPYADEQAWQSIAIQGATISDNAAFAVLHEICCAPIGEASAALQHKMLEFWVTQYSHPISPIVVEAGKAIIDQTDLPLETVLKYMDQIAPYYGLYNALAIVYFACDDITGEADKKYNEILGKWQK